MLKCFSFKAVSAASPSISQANFAEDTRQSSSAAEPSHPVNLIHEFTLALQTQSFNEVLSRVHFYDPIQDQLQIQEENGDRKELLLSQVLQPNRQCVEAALSHAKPTTLTSLVSSYFDHSESATNLCQILYKSVHSARELYRPLFDLLDVLPCELHAITESQCNWAFDIFLQFDSFDNPLPSPDSHNFHEMRRCFSQLKQQLDHRLRKSRSRVRLLDRATAGPLCSAYLHSNFKKKELAHISQLDAASKGNFVLKTYLDTLDRLVFRLHTAIEGDKLLIRLGLERGRDIYPVQEVVKQLRKNHVNFIHQLKYLENSICLCFDTVNETRSLLLQEINLHRSYSS